MNEEIKYYEIQVGKLQDAVNDLNFLLTTISMDGLIGEGDRNRLKGFVDVIEENCHFYLIKHLRKLYARQDNEIPNAPTFTQGDQ